MSKDSVGATMLRTQLTAYVLRFSLLISLGCTVTACGSSNQVNQSNGHQNHHQTNDPSLAETSSHPLRIAAATNLAHTLPDLIDDYLAKDYQQSNSSPPHNIEVTYGSSGKLYAQIKAGAPYDIYLSANQTYPAKLSESQPSKYGKPFTYARGQLVLYSNRKHSLNHIPINEIELSNLLNSDTKIAIANPELAPYGYATKAYLQSHHLYKPLLDNKQLIQTENISQVLQYVQSGNVDYGFVALAQLKSLSSSNTTSIPQSNNPQSAFTTLTLNEYPAILQDGLVLSSHSDAQPFAEFLKASATQQYLQNVGYAPIE